MRALVSSAYEEENICTSLMTLLSEETYMLKSMGPRTDPWGTPKRVASSSDVKLYYNIQLYPQYLCQPPVLSSAPSINIQMGNSHR